MSTPYLYKWTHLPTGKWYIGSKSSVGCHPDLHERYICSSRVVKPLVKANREEWSLSILVIGPAAYVRLLEKKLLRTLNAKDDPMSYNQNNACVEYDRTGIKDSVETRLKKSRARQGEKNPSYGKKGLLSPIYGREHNEETKQKIRDRLKVYAADRPAEHNEKISKSLKGNPNVGCKGEKNGMFGKKATEHNKLMSRVKNSGKNNPMCKPENQVLCGHCGKTVAKNHYTMYHGLKCKSLR